MSAANKAHLDMQQFIEMESSKSMLKFIKNTKNSTPH